MVSCSVMTCCAKRNKKWPNLTMHRLPQNKVLREKWIKAIGQENINQRRKTILICSLHFDESCFNRTLEVTRLRDDSVPTISLQGERASSEVEENSYTDVVYLEEEILTDNETTEDTEKPIVEQKIKSSDELDKYLAYLKTLLQKVPEESIAELQRDIINLTINVTQRKNNTAKCDNEPNNNVKKSKSSPFILKVAVP